jgi:hypothetical protein
MNFRFHKAPSSKDFELNITAKNVPYPVRMSFRIESSSRRLVLIIEFGPNRALEEHGVDFAIFPAVGGRKERQDITGELVLLRRTDSRLTGFLDRYVVGASSASMRPPNRIDSRDKFCIKGDFRRGQGLGDRAIFFRVFGKVAKKSLADPGDGRFRRKLDPRNLESGRCEFDLHPGGGRDSLGNMAGLGQVVGESHRKTAGVGGGDELFRIRPRPLLESRRESERALE